MKHQLSFSKPYFCKYRKSYKKTDMKVILNLSLSVNVHVTWWTGLQENIISTWSVKVLNLSKPRFEFLQGCRAYVQLESLTIYYWKTDSIQNIKVEFVYSIMCVFLQLILLTPKSLLRLEAARSHLDEMTEGMRNCNSYTVKCSWQLWSVRG